MCLARHPHQERQLGTNRVVSERTSGPPPYSATNGQLVVKINLRNEQTGAARQCKVGFSWTTLFFGFFPAIFRGDWKWGLIQFLIGFVTLGLSSFVFMFIYNKLYIQDLLNNGFIPSDDFSALTLQNKGIAVPATRIAVPA